LSDDEPSITTIDLQLKELLHRVHELEAMSEEKDAEIARLREELERREQGAAPPGEASYKEQFQHMKMQYEKLKEALALEGKVRRVRAITLVA
jgi:predicted RNase H-like nuclease (RuvC/YqgF family)